MSKASEIKQIIRNIAAYNSGITLFEAEVVSSEDTQCTIKYQGLEHKNVRLVSGFSQSLTTMVIKPAVGSTVLVADLSNGKMRDLIVLMIEKAETVTFNGGELGGLIKIEELVTKLNTLEKDLNSLKTAFKGWTPAPQDGGAALKTAVTTWANQSITETAKSDLEDETVKH